MDQNPKSQPQPSQPPKDELGILHPMEVQLIKFIRNRFRYGQIVILVRDGLPYRIEKHTEYQDLKG